MASSWQDRAATHRKACPILQGQRPPKPHRIEYSPPAPKEVVYEQLYDPSLAAEPLDLLCSDGDEDDGDCQGVLSRVELSRYIARKNAGLAALAETSRQQRLKFALGDGDWQGEVPGGHAGHDHPLPGLEDAAAWSLVLEAVAFERKHLKRGSSNNWPDAFWSPACLCRLRPDALAQLDAELASLLPQLDASEGDGDDSSFRALPASVFMRQLLSGQQSGQFS